MAGTSETAPDLRPCPGCGDRVPEVDGPTHRYIGASAGCWALYGEVLAKEYEGYALYAPVHRLTVDAYAAQHPGAPSRLAVQSVAVHLVRLHFQLERGLPHEEANAVMLRVSAHAKDSFTWLEPPETLGAVTVLDVLDAESPADHVERVREWAKSVWDAWSPHHDTVRRWAEL